MCSVVLRLSCAGNSFIKVANSVRSADFDFWDMADVALLSSSSLDLDGDGTFFFRKARRDGRRDLRVTFACAAVLVEWVVVCERTEREEDAGLCPADLADLLEVAVSVVVVSVDRNEDLTEDCREPPSILRLWLAGLLLLLLRCDSLAMLTLFLDLGVED